MPRAWYSTERVQETAKRVAAFFGILLLLWALSTISWFAPFFHTLQGAAYWASSGVAQTFSRIFANEESLANQLSACTTMLSDQAVRAASLATAADEVAQWRAVFEYTDREEVKGIAARIIARGDLASSNVLIDRGESDGVQIGAAIVIGQGELFGTVKNVSSTQSLVQLSEDPESAIPAEIFGQKKTIGLVEGNEGAVLTMRYIPQEAAITVGDSVVTSGLGGKIPRGLLIGTVTEISTEPSAPFLSATVTPVHDARSWTSVLVMPYAAPEL